MSNQIKKSKWLIPVIVIVGIIIAGLIVWGAYELFKSTPKLEEITEIIYADVQFDEDDDHLAYPDMTFYSIRADGTRQKKLFTIKYNESWFQWNFPGIKFCSNSQKMYSVGYFSYIKTIKEMNLDGTLRDLKFSGIDTSEYFEEYKYNEPRDMGFILSPNCQKIIRSTIFYAKDDAVNEITIYDINTFERKVLSTIHHQDYIFPSDFPGIFPGKYIEKWSSENPEIVYLSDSNGDLYTININTGFISKVADLGGNQIIDDISSDENLIAHYPRRPTESYMSFVTDFKNDLKIPIQNTSSGDREFSPDNKKLANIDFDCSGVGVTANCIPNLYISDYKNENKKISENTELRGWLSDNIILGQKADSLIAINFKGTEENHIITTDGYLIFIAIIK